MISKRKLSYMVMPVFAGLEEEKDYTKVKNTKFRHGQVRGLIRKYMATEWFLIALYKYMISNWMEIKRHADAHQKNEYLRTKSFFAKFLRKRGMNPNAFFAKWGL